MQDQVTHTVAVAKLVVVPVEKVNRAWKILVSGKSCSIQETSWAVAKENILDSLKSSYSIYKIQFDHIPIPVWFDVLKQMDEVKLWLGKEGIGLS